MSIEAQLSAKQNAEEIKNMLGDLSKWENEIKKEDEKLTSLKDSSKVENSKESQKALQLKVEGNKLYGDGKYIEAVRIYSEAILLDQNNAVLPANRAMAHLKLENYIAAEADCSLSLSIDQDYVKALFRRATARNKQNKLKPAAEDYKKVLTLEPGNKEAKKELEKINIKLSPKNKSTTSKNKESISEDECKPGRYKASFRDTPLNSSTQKKYTKVPIRDVSAKSSIPTIIT